MRISFSPDLRQQEIYAQGEELAAVMGLDRKDGKRILTYPSSRKQLVHTFTDPILVSDNWRIAQLEPTLRDTLFALYGSSYREFEYDGVTTHWNPSHVNVWSPSIDTVLFASGLGSV